MTNVLFFIDIDGTIADASRRFKRAGKEPKRRGKAYTNWLRKVQNPKSLAADAPIRGMAELLHRLPQNSLVYLTGRSEVYRKLTLDWLSRNGFPQGSALLMRPVRNFQTAGALKEHHIEIEASSYLLYPTVVVIDDDYTGELEMVCKKRQWTFLKARSGGY